MTHLIQPSAESVLITGASAFLPTKVCANGMDGYFVVQARLQIPAKAAKPVYESGTPVREMAQRYETDSRKAEALSRARQKIARRLEGASNFSLSALRLKMGLSQTQLGERMGVAQPQIARIERGDDVKISTIEKLAEALGLPKEEVCLAAFATRRAKEIEC